MPPIENNDANVADQLRWRIPCVGPDGKDNAVTVLVMGDRVDVVLPPGNVIVLDTDEAQEFSQLLDSANSYAAEPDPSPVAWTGNRGNFSS